MGALVVGGEIAAGGGDGGPLRALAGGEFDLGTDPVAVGFVSDQAEE